METRAVQLCQIPCGAADAAERDTAGNVLHHVKVSPHILIKNKDQKNVEIEW